MRMHTKRLTQWHPNVIASVVKQHLSHLSLHRSRTPTFEISHYRPTHMNHSFYIQSSAPVIRRHRYFLQFVFWEREGQQANVGFPTTLKLIGFPVWTNEEPGILWAGERRCPLNNCCPCMWWASCQRNPTICPVAGTVNNIHTGHLAQMRPLLFGLQICVPTYWRSLKITRPEAQKCDERSALLNSSVHTVKISCPFRGTEQFHTRLENRLIRRQIRGSAQDCLVQIHDVCVYDVRLLYWEHNNESGIIYFMNFTQSAASCMILLEVGACIEMGGGRIRLRGSYDVICGVLTALNCSLIKVEGA